jgi:pimeloyl-ACP methyl ester carboxylesterase
MASGTTAEFGSAERGLFGAYGLEVESRFLEMLNPPLRVRVMGSGEGPPVVLVHGGGGVGATWAPLMAGLSGMRLVVVDRPGFGLSGGFDYRGVDLRRHAVAFLESLLDGLGLERAALVGNSMGGLWSFWLALDRPERVSALAQLGSTALLTDTMAPLPMRLLSVPGLNRLMLAAERPTPEQAKKVLARLGHDPAVIEDRLPEEFFEMLAASEKLPGYATAWLTLVERCLGLRGAVSDVRLGEDELRRVQQPTLFVWGDGDVFGGPEIGERAVRVMPDGRIEAVAGGHLPWLDEPEICAEVVSEFLRPRSNAATTKMAFVTGDGSK